MNPQPPKKPAIPPLPGAGKKANPTPKAKYGVTDVESILASLDKSLANRSRFNPKQAADYAIRLCPPKAGSVKAVWEFGLHYNPGMLPGCEELGDRFVILCLRLTFGQDCPLCRIVDRLYIKAKAQKNPQHIKQFLSMAGQGKAKKRYVWNIVWMDQPNRGVLTWEHNEDTFIAISTLFKRFGILTDPEPDGEGQVLSVQFKITGDRGQYCSPQSVQPTMEKTPIPVKNWEEQLHDLEAYVMQAYVSAEDLREIILGSQAKPEESVAEATEDTEEVSEEQLDDLFEEVSE